MKKILYFLGIIFVCLVSCSSSSTKSQNFVKAAKSAKSVVLVNVYKTNDSTCEKELYGFGSGIIWNNEVHEIFIYLAEI